MRHFLHSRARPLFTIWPQDPASSSPVAGYTLGVKTAVSKWADAPGNVLLSARSTSLPKDSVANVSRIVALDKTALTERVGKLSAARIQLLLTGIDVVLGMGL